MAVLCCTGSFDAEKSVLPLAAAPFDRANNFRGAARLLYRRHSNLSRRLLCLDYQVPSELRECAIWTVHVFEATPYWNSGKLPQPFRIQAL